MSQTVVEILGELQRRGVMVTAVGEELVLKPKRALDDTLISRVREAKAAILEALRNQPATCAASCYEIGSGKRIHHPWNGCTRINPKNWPPMQTEVVQ